MKQSACTSHALQENATSINVWFCLAALHLYFQRKNYASLSFKMRCTARKNKKPFGSLVLRYVIISDSGKDVSWRGGRSSRPGSSRGRGHGRGRGPEKPPCVEGPGRTGRGHRGRGSDNRPGRSRGRGGEFSLKFCNQKNTSNLLTINTRKLNIGFIYNTRAAGRSFLHSLVLCASVTKEYVWL